MQLFCCFITATKIKENKKEKDDFIINNDDTKKYEINNNNKYVSSFLFSTFKLIEKVRNFFNLI